MFYFLKGANRLKFCQKGDVLRLGSYSYPSACPYPSGRRYCPGFMGSCGGGYAGGPDRPTPEKTDTREYAKFNA